MKAKSKPSPTPTPMVGVKDLLKHKYPKTWEVMDAMPDGWFLVVMTFVGTILGTKIINTLLDHRRQSTKAAMLEMMADFTAKHTESMAKYTEKIEGRYSQNMVDITKLEHTQKTILKELKSTKEMINSKFGEYDRRFIKLEQRK